MMPLTERVGDVSLKTSSGCKLVIRKDQIIAPVVQFVTEGLQIGQQVIVMAGPRFLREVARSLGEAGLRPEAALRNGRVVFLTAPGCISTLLKPDDPLQRRGPVRTNAPLLRWVSDWTWTYGRGMEPARSLEYQRRVHDFTRSLGALSLCTALGPELDRNSTLALLADHRRALRAGERAAHPQVSFAAAGAGR